MKLAAPAILVSTLLLCGAGPAPPNGELENVIVTAPRIPDTPNAIAHDVIRSYASPSLMLGQLPRWNTPLCPRTDGLSSRTLNSFVTQRIRQVASLAGAPLADEPCKSNIEILFAANPQGALDTLHDANPTALGYRGATTMSHPVQAWYETGITDLRNHTEVDHDVAGQIEFTNGGGFVGITDNGAPIYIGEATTNGIPQAYIQGWRNHPDLRSDLLGIFIIADSKRTSGYQLGPVADYIAMMALSQTKAFETCQVAPSITNLMAPANCDKLKVQALSPADIGYLRGVYKMDPGGTLQTQQNDIAAEMVKAMAEGK